MTYVRLAALALALPLVAACVKTETVVGTIVYPPGQGPQAESPDDYGTGVERPTGAAAKPAYRRPTDDYQMAVDCAAAQRKLMTLNSYMVTREDLYDMEDAARAWTGTAIDIGAERGLTAGQVVDAIERRTAKLGSHEADRISAACIVTE